MDTSAQSSQLDPAALTIAHSEALLAAAAEVLAVESIRHLRVDRQSLLRPGLAPTLEIRGRLLLDSARAYEVTAQRFRALGHVALLRREGGDDLILAVPGALPAAGSRAWPAIALFAATLLSMLSVGAMNEQPAGGQLDLLSGLPFAASLLGILLAHEIGHYVMARRVGVPASLPYFIPLPFTIFGTLGAVIRMKGIPQNRRKLFAVAIAGPLAGLAVTLPILVIGLLLSPVGSLPSGAHYVQEGNSLLYAGVKYILFGRLLPSGGEDVFLHPVALAGWAGLLVTGLNLIPAGQLDGGHIMGALLGRRARWLTTIVMLVLVALSVYWQGWLLWAALVFLLGRSQVVSLDEITSLRRRERALAVLAFLLFLLIFTPIPLVEG